MLQLLLSESRRVRAKINPHLEKLMVPRVEKMWSAFEPGLNSVNWLSVNIEVFLGAVQQAVTELELIVDRSNDLISNRIDEALQLMAAETLCECPTTEPWTVDHFTSRIAVCDVIVLKRKVRY